METFHPHTQARIPEVMLHAGDEMIRVLGGLIFTHSVCRLQLVDLLRLIEASGRQPELGVVANVEQRAEPGTRLLLELLSVILVIPAYAGLQRHPGQGQVADRPVERAAGAAGIAHHPAHLFDGDADQLGQHAPLDERGGIVAAFLVCQLSAQLQRQRVRQGQALTVTQLPDPELTFIGETRVAFFQVFVGNESIAVVLDVAVGEDGAGRHALGPLSVQLQPAVGVPVHRAGQLTVALVQILQLHIVIVEYEPGLQLGLLVQLVTETAEVIRVPRSPRTGVEHVQHQVQVAATTRQRPAAATVGGGTDQGSGGGEKAHHHVGAEGTDFVRRLDVHDAAHPVAIADGKSAGVDIHGFDHAGVETREHALEVLQVKRLEQLHVIEQHQGLVLQTAAHVGPGRQADGRGARQMAGHSQNVVAELRNLLEILGGQRVDGGTLRALERVAARNHHHLFHAGFGLQSDLQQCVETHLERHLPCLVPAAAHLQRRLTAARQLKPATRIRKHDLAADLHPHTGQRLAGLRIEHPALHHRRPLRRFGIRRDHVPGGCP